MPRIVISFGLDPNFQEWNRLQLPKGCKIWKIGDPDDDYEPGYIHESNSVEYEIETNEMLNHIIYDPDNKVSNFLTALDKCLNKLEYCNLSMVAYVDTRFSSTVISEIEPTLMSLLGNYDCMLRIFSYMSGYVEFIQEDENGVYTCLRNDIN